MIYFSVVSLHPWISTTISLTRNESQLAYRWEGFCNVEVLPSPKSHCQLTILSLDRSWKTVVSFRHTGAALKLAIGSHHTLTLPLIESSQLFASLT